jgi:hypothetical protein
MGKAEKLFQNSGIEYITPFLKLWLSFNAWYKQDSEHEGSIRTDRDAINKYKLDGRIKHHFKLLMKDNSDKGMNFKEALSNLANHLHKNYSLLDKEGKSINYNPIYEGVFFYDTKKPKGIIIYSLPNYVELDVAFEDAFFSKTIEIIYAIRCQLMHGDFDLDNKYFVELVKNAYLVLYPIMEEIFK